MWNAKEEYRHSTRRKSERSTHCGAFDRSTCPKIIRIPGEKTSEPSGFHSWETRRQQGRERTCKEIDGRRAVRYCPKSRISALGRQIMSYLDPITPSGRIVEKQLDDHLLAVQKQFKSDALAFVGPLFGGADESIREAVEFIHAQGKPHKRKPAPIKTRAKLTLILDTIGGYSEIAERIADLLHKHFDIVEFVVPNRAMSAGTILVMSGNEIWMDYYSVLGPIDPQLQGPKGESIPANGYLVKYKELIEKSRRGRITTAELQFLVSSFNPAELYQYQQEMNLSVTLLKEWLVKYKFANWNETETTKKKVTKKMKLQRAASVANTLQDTDKWHSHSRGISMDILRKDVNLKIQDFGGDDCVTNCVRVYYKLLIDYMIKLGTPTAVHVVKNFFPMRFAR
jgi:hypothetical protein